MEIKLHDAAATFFLPAEGVQIFLVYLSSIMNKHATINLS